MAVVDSCPSGNCKRLQRSFLFIFSLGAKIWLPKTLLKLMNYDAFCIYLTDEAASFEQSLLRKVLLDSIMKGIPDVKYRIEYFILNEKLKFTGASAKDRFSTSPEYDSQISKMKVPYHIGLDSCYQFAIIDKDHLQLGILYLHISRQILWRQVL